MEVMVGSARSDENGKLTGGISGDQTGREVMEQLFYVAMIRGTALLLLVTEQDPRQE